MGESRARVWTLGAAQWGKERGAMGCGAVRRGMWIRGGSEAEGSRSQTLQGLEGHRWGVWVHSGGTVEP